MKFLRTHFSIKKLRAISIIGFLVIPFLIHLSYQANKMALHETLDYLYSPDYSKNYQIDTSSLISTLEVIKKSKGRRNVDFLDSNQTPYLSSYYNRLVLDNLTLSDAKIRIIEKVFLGKPSYDNSPERLVNKDVAISKIETTTTFDDNRKEWATWVNFEITNSNPSTRLGEYATTLDLPTGCWISDYYLNVNGVKEMGILAEKKAAMWIFSQIRNENRDPGLLYYRTGNQVSFRVFPFAHNEVRQTGIQFIHKEPALINIDGNLVQLGDYDHATTEGTTVVNENVVYVPSAKKKNLTAIQRTPYYHFIVDASKDKEHLQINFAKRIEACLANQPLKGQAKISYTNAHVRTENLEENWEEKLTNHSFSGGFYVERAIKKILVNSYEKQEDRYPIIVVVTNVIHSAIIEKNFADFQFTFPEGHLFYDLDFDGNLVPHSLVERPKEALADTTVLLTFNKVLAWPNQDAPTAYLPNDTLPSIILKASTFEVDESLIAEKNWNTGLLMQGKWFSQILHPEKGDKEWLDLVRYSFTSRIMSPHTSYIVVENEAQKAMLKKKQAQILAGKKALDAGEDVQRMSEPELYILILLMGIFFVTRRRRKVVIR